MEYLDNTEFTEQLREYKETSSRKIYNEIGKKFLLIANHLLNKWNFTSYTIERKQDMQSVALLFMTKYMKNFNEEKGTAFNYFTQIAYRACQQYIIDRKKYDGIFKTSQFFENLAEVEEEFQEYI